MPADQEVVLEEMRGNAMELGVELDPQDAAEVSLCVLRSPGNEEYTRINYLRGDAKTVQRDGRTYRQVAIGIDVAHASLHPAVKRRPHEVGPLELAEGEPLKLRVFVDRSVVEVFANGRQCVAVRVYPQKSDSLGVSLRAAGGQATLLGLDAWQMKSIWK